MPVRAPHSHPRRLLPQSKASNPLDMQSSIIHKLMSLVTVISETHTPLTFSELVTQTGLNKSTLHRLLAIAIEEELVQHDKGSKVYLLGSKVFDLVRNAYSGYDIQAIALDEMIRLHGMFNENVTLGVPSGTDVIYLRMLEAKGSMGGIQRPGMREPVHCSASGKVLMAFLPDAIINAKLANHNFERFTDRTITDAASFCSALETVRKQGFATNDREEYEHFLGISAPIFNYLGEPTAVLNIWTIETRHGIEDVRTWSDALVASANAVTKLIGGKAPEFADAVVN